MAEQRFKKFGENDDDFSVGFKLPQTRPVLDELTAELRRSHQAETEEEEKAEKAGNPKKKRKRPDRTICCCGNPSCRIGPFNRTQGGEVDA